MTKLSIAVLRLFFILCLAGILLVSFNLPQAANAKGDRPTVLVLTVDGPLTPTYEEYLSRGVQAAQAQGAQALIVQLNTPGGSIDVMTRLLEIIRASAVPVVVYVMPQGAMAGSAGSLVTLAGHVAAMAPETTIGAASPVGENGQDLDKTMQEKTKNILKATVRTLTERRGQKATTLAENMIDTAAAVSAKEALDVGLIDFVAVDLKDLLRQLNGFHVRTNGGERVLQTANPVVVPLPTSFIEHLLVVLTNPNIILILLDLGAVAILIELSNPGAWVPGFIGVVSLTLAVYGLGALPVNWFGIIFLVVAFVLFILDIKAPTHGALTAAGIGSMIVGGLVLFNSPGLPAVQHVSVPLVVVSSLVTGGMFLGILIYGLRAQRIPLRTGPETLIGRSGTAVTDLLPAGQVQLGSELWSAQSTDSQTSIPKGTRVRVVKVVGVRLLVEKSPEQG